MPKVLVDERKWCFRRYTENPSHIYELLMGAFAEQRRSLVKFIVDGEDALQTGEFLEKFDQSRQKA